MSSKALIVATLTEPPDEERLARLSELAAILEVRADLVRGVEVEWLRSRFAGELLYTLRSRAEGGESEASPETRRRRLGEAARHYDLVDIEGQRDLGPGLLRAIRPEKRLISWHGPPSTLVSLQQVFAPFSEVEARYYKLVPAAEQPPQELAPLALLHSLRRRDLIAFASGRVGTWTRLVAPRLGAPVIFGSAGERPAVEGQPTVERLAGDFCLPDLPALEGLFGLVGADIDHSLSPRLHNVTYRQLGLPYLYLPFTVEAFGDFWLEVVESGSLQELGLELKGLSVTAPHKRIAAAVAGASSPLVEWLGSANTLIWHDEVWEAESTDGEGVVDSLRQRGRDPAGRRAAVVGAGGAGRAAVVALRQAGAEVTLVNRDPERGRRAASDLRVPFRALAGLDPGGFEILVQATPLGRRPDDPVVVDPTRLRPEAIVLDFVYLPDRPTALVEAVRAAGRAAIDGREVLVAQAVPQFRLMTGREMPVDAARRLVGLEADG